MRLKRNHAYFYQVCVQSQLDFKLLFLTQFVFFQVQCQLFCTGREYCDFIVWTKNDIFVERIHPDAAFWRTNIPRAETFFRTAILLEIIGRFYSRPAEVHSMDTSLTPAADDDLQKTEINIPLPHLKTCCTVIVVDQRRVRWWPVTTQHAHMHNGFTCLAWD